MSKSDREIVKQFTKSLGHPAGYGDLTFAVITYLLLVEHTFKDKIQIRKIKQWLERTINTMVDIRRKLEQDDKKSTSKKAGCEAAIVYGSTPSRLKHKTEAIMRLAAREKKACLHPFKALPYKYYEGGCVGRKKSMDVCCRLIDVCDEFWIFGISEGTLIELEYHLELNDYRPGAQTLRVFIKEYDPEWQEYYKKFRRKYQRAIKALAPFLKAK